MGSRPYSSYFSEKPMGIDDSSRPIMAPSVSSKRTSKRFSTYSSLLSTTTETPLTSAHHHASSSPHASSTGSDTRLQDIKEWSDGLDRLDNKHLQQQRYHPTPEKSDNLSKLALGAKVERALGRRMTDQDATFRKINEKVVGEKPARVGRSVTTAS
ncbi:MAG: hypothetical protein Q9222_003094 [Ikaeria aurantiellina]